MTDKELDERVNSSMEAFSAYQKELNRNFTFADFADFMFKAGAQLQGERVYQRIIKSIDCSDEWHDSNIQNWLERNKKTILGENIE